LWGEGRGCGEFGGGDMNCSHDGCSFERYKSSDKCIFHCEKDNDDWKNLSGTFKKREIDKFWQQIREKDNEINNDFSYFIFPSFQNCDLNLVDNGGVWTTSNQNSLKELNFGKINTRNYYRYYSSLDNTNFSNATFLDNADFSKIYFENSIDFTNTTFKKDIKFSRKYINYINFSNAIFEQKVTLVDFTINGCSFVKATFEEKADFTNVNFSSRETNFNEASFEKEVIFTDVSFGISVDFTDAEFNKKLLFNVKSINGELNFTDVAILDDALFKDIEYIKDQAIFDGLKVTGKFDISNSKFYDYVSMDNISLDKDINLSNSTFQNTLHISIEKASSIDLSDSKIDKDFRFSSNKIDNTNFKNLKVSGNAYFIKCNIRDITIFENLDVEKNLAFCKCDFKKDLDLIDIKTGDKLHISNSSIDGKFLIKEQKTPKIFIKDLEVKEDINLSNNDFKNIIIYHSTFKNSFLCKKCNIENNAVFSNIEVGQTLNLQELETNKLLIKSSKIGEVLNISNSILTKKADFQDIEINSFIAKKCEFNSNIEFTKVKCQNLSLKETTILENLILTSTDIERKSDFYKLVVYKNIDIQDSKLLGKVDFGELNNFYNDEEYQKFKEQNTKSYFYIDNNSKFGSVAFKDSKFLMDFKIKDSNFEKLSFDNLKFYISNKFILQKIDIDEFELINNENESEKFLLDYVKVNKKMLIKRTRFESETFNQMDISKCDIEIDDSSFNDSFFETVKWGQITEDRFKADRNIFRQLKHRSENHKNFIDADGFYALEMKERKKELNAERKQLLSMKDKIINFFSHTAIFYLHEKTSNFSQSWILPIILILILGMIGVICHNWNGITDENFKWSMGLFIVNLIIQLIFYKHAQKKNIYYLIGSTVFIFYWFYTQDFLDDIAKQLNPVNIFQSYKNKDIEYEFIYLIYRIAILFLVYQTIVAIKKKVRSK
jgi:hypothetical protein